MPHRTENIVGKEKKNPLFFRAKTVGHQRRVLQNTISLTAILETMGLGKRNFQHTGHIDERCMHEI